MNSVYFTVSLLFCHFKFEKIRHFDLLKRTLYNYNSHIGCYQLLLESIYQYLINGNVINLDFHVKNLTNLYFLIFLNSMNYCLYTLII